MSKASKLNRMKNTILETTGLSYTPSGETVELNFFPNSTDTGVSVPIIVSKGSGSCAAIDVPTTGHPYAYIVDSKAYNVYGGRFHNVSDTTQPGFVLPGGGGGANQVYRSRTFNEKIVDEIGIELEEVESTSYDGGGPGTFLKFPIGTYRLSGSAPQINTDRSALYWCNYTKANAETTFSNRRDWLKDDKGIIGTVEFASVSHHVKSKNFITGIFYVTESTDKWVLLHGSETEPNDSNHDYGFGIHGNSGSFFSPTGVIYSKLEIWKIG